MTRHRRGMRHVLRMLLATTRAVESVPIVRVPATQYHMISQALDLGAMGIVVPMVETVEQGQVIVRSAKYPPAGRRGAAFGVAHDDYLGGDVLAKMTSANEETMLVAQIKTVTGLENVERIAAICEGLVGRRRTLIGRHDCGNA